MTERSGFEPDQLKNTGTTGYTGETGSRMASSVLGRFLEKILIQELANLSTGNTPDQRDHRLDQPLDNKYLRIDQPLDDKFSQLD